jgi:hypothetical protein
MNVEFNDLIHINLFIKLFILYYSVVGTLVSGFILHGETKIDKIIEVAQRIALMTLKTHNSVSEDISESLLKF